MLVALLVFVAFLGAAFGSFGGVVASRGLRNSLGGRSHCEGCGRTLGWYELVPLLSYVWLRGRCRSCRERIGVRAFAWEAGGAALALAIALPLVMLRGLPPV
jgi:leader peptidase (prepilin peptidase) / N-methyltransferase